ncbi:MAG TPA: helix-turn-helix domain-containing protein [Microbacterium sp.]|uniref:helix-turn-helix domain-containing protein n=1 Tax=Microbacterium sp. TaxID=51671 RepID=UPI002CBE22F2|nr:helix-turn-helix domain-containing protein [Microbacterium sp.]HWI31700.1 helix-turn-helix domain-containing protein [Microbacterium sp.]
MSAGDRESASGVQVIARAAAILRELKDEPSSLSLRQLATRLDLPRSTVQRIVGALQQERLVVVTNAGRGIRLGPC